MTESARETDPRHIFISYSHEDEIWLERLKTVLRPVFRKETVELWDDTRIAAGDRWRAEIDTAIHQASVAILLVSADYLASDFINENELPPLLDRAERDGTRIIWIPIAPSLYDRTPIAHYQAAWDPRKPLSGLSESQQEEALVQIAEEIDEVVHAPTYPARTHERQQELQKGLEHKSPWSPGEWYRAFSDRPLLLTAVVSLVISLILIGIGGAYGHRAREAILGCSPMEYPGSALIALGFRTFFSLTFCGLTVPFAHVDVLQNCAWVLIGFTALTGWTVFVGRRWPTVALAILFVVGLSLLRAADYYTVAVYAENPDRPKTSRVAVAPRGDEPDEEFQPTGGQLEGSTNPESNEPSVKPSDSDPDGSTDDSEERQTGQRIDDIAFETQSWLVNPGHRRDRKDLTGLLFWFLATITAGLVSLIRVRAEGWRRVVRWLLVPIWLIPFATNAGMLPRAYAYGEWGRSYPEVAAADPIIDRLPEPEAIRSAMAAGESRLFCVSETSKRVVFWAIGGDYGQGQPIVLPEDLVWLGNEDRFIIPILPKGGTP